MALITWNPEWETGIPIIDDDHRAVIEIINELDEAIQAGEEEFVIGLALGVLNDYVRYHFQREELLFAACDYPFAADHIEEHGTLRKAIKDALIRYERLPQAFDGTELLELLQVWWGEHILNEDQRYKPYVAGHAEALAEAEKLTVEG